jgi:hypothetical protein
MNEQNMEKRRRDDYCFQPSMNFSQLSLRMREWMERRGDKRNEHGKEFME